ASWLRARFGNYVAISGQNTRCWVTERFLKLFVSSEGVVFGDQMLSRLENYFKIACPQDGVAILQCSVAEPLIPAIYRNIFSNFQCSGGTSEKLWFCPFHIRLN